MKLVNVICLFALLLVLSVCSCSNRGTEEMSGTYVNHAASEFSVAEDTLVLSPLDGDRFQLIRKTGYRLLDESGKPGKLILESETWEVLWDEALGAFQDRRKGRTISFDRKTGELVLESSRYKRMN